MPMPPMKERSVERLPSGICVYSKKPSGSRGPMLYLPGVPLHVAGAT
jgi:hypothetical protein